MAVASPTCIICLHTQFNEYKGLLIKGRHICHKCERRIIVLNSDDPDYDYYKWGLKKIWDCPTNA